MKRLFDVLIRILEKWSCHHEWSVYHQTEIYSQFANVDTDVPMKRRHTLICKKCGKIKKINV